MTLRASLPGIRVERLHSAAFEVVGLAFQSPLFATRSEADAWLATKMDRLPATRLPQVRACLCCGRGFASDGAHHRLCGACRGRDPGPVGCGLPGQAGRKVGRAAGM